VRQLYPTLADDKGKTSEALGLVPPINPCTFHGHPIEAGRDWLTPDRTPLGISSAISRQAANSAPKKSPTHTARRSQPQEPIHPIVGLSASLGHP